MKAWVIYDDEFAYPVHAETRGKARMMHSEEHGSGGSYGFEEMLKVRIKRAPEFDDLDRFDAYEMLRLGYVTYWECYECSVETTIDGDGEEESKAVGIDGVVYCAICAPEAIRKELSYGA